MGYVSEAGQDARIRREAEVVWDEGGVLKNIRKWENCQKWQERIVLSVPIGEVVEGLLRFRGEEVNWELMGGHGGRGGDG